MFALVACAAVVSGAGYHVLSQQQDALRQKDDAEKKLLATQEQIALVKSANAKSNATFVRA